jgi:hypothetical protein
MVKSRKLKMTKSRKSRINKVRKSRNIRKSINRKRGGGVIQVRIYDKSSMFIAVKIDDSMTVMDLKKAFVAEWANKFPERLGYELDRIQLYIMNDRRKIIEDNMSLSQCGIVNDTVMRVLN